ncbi:hypothetical protein QQ045_014267 [Rhodiola kirilowii]
MWKQRSRVDWLRYGDKNTAFFHARASQRRQKNWIEKLMNDRGEWESGDEAVANIIGGYFREIFSSSIVGSHINWEHELNSVQPRISDEMNGMLEGDVTEEEIKKAVYQLGSTKAPGPDGFPAIFYQSGRDVIGQDFIAEIKKFFTEDVLDPAWNQTHIVLVPKVKEVQMMTDLRPISLCNVSMKLITKILANRLQIILNEVISCHQSAFVKGRIIVDNFVVAHEVAHFIKGCKNKKKGYASLKLDMSKAYDRIEWIFLEKIMRRLGFGETWIRWVLKCVTTVTYRVKFNDCLTDVIVPSRGLRQGDPISPYLFILCMELLDSKISEGVSRGQMSGIKISRSAPAVSHLFFADDYILFLKADDSQATNLRRIIGSYEAISGQRVNYRKSKLYSVEIDIVEKVWRKTMDWKHKLLSGAGREVLVKAVLQSLPVYSMTVFSFPQRVRDELTKLLVNFWWNNKKCKGVHWIRRELLMEPKNNGGIGFKNLDIFNEALIMRLCWRIVTYPDLLMSRVIKGKYFPTGSLETALLGYRSSNIWQSIMKVRDVFCRGLSWLENETQCCWNQTSNGIFTTSSAYALIKKCQEDNDGYRAEQSDKTRWTKFWRVFWASKVPNKIKVFNWRLFYNSLPDAMNMVKRGVHCDLWCKICGKGNETVGHLIKECWWGKSLWESLGLNELDVFRAGDIADVLWWFGLNKGVGITCQDDDGCFQWVGARAIADGMCVAEVEGRALELASRWAEEEGITNATFVSDSAKFVEAVILKGNMQAWMGQWFAPTIERFLKFKEWRVVKVPREENSVADGLAKKACFEDWCWTRKDAIPWLPWK